MSETGRGANRILAKLRKSVENQSFYEAHQMYRTLYARYVIGGKYDEALNLIYDGATILLSNNQQTSGADIALLYLEGMGKAGLKMSEEHIERISRMYEMMDNSIEERHQFLVMAIKYSTDNVNKMGHPGLHKSFAKVLWNEQNFASSCYHFLRSDSGSNCGMMLVQWQLRKGYASEVDLFVVRPVLQYLCLQKTTEASDVFQSYTTSHPHIKSQKGPPYFLPLLNFLWLLLLAVNTKKQAHFTVLCVQYQPSLKRDPVYSEYLDKIGQLFFNIPAPQTRQSTGFLGNLLEGLMESMNDDSTEEITAPELD